MDKKTAFLNGILDGLSSPMGAFNPREIKTPISKEALGPSYRSPEEDLHNMRKYFERAVTYARKEVATAK